MSAQTVIDSLEFARTEQTLRGGLPIADLPRLRESLYDTRGLIDFVVQGGHDARRRPMLSLEVNGVLHLTCQRCLGPLEHRLRLASTLILAGPGAADSAALDEEDVEWIESSEELDMAGLVEDEIILALPYSPRHPEGQCGAAPTQSNRQESPSAFAKLAALKRN